MFQKQYNDYLDKIEGYLDALPLDSSLLAKSMKYSVVGGGKRIRPVLALACADLVGGCSEKIVGEASALELIHTYSLIHDDLPSMDNDDYRRGKLSNHKMFGEAAAILAGDALLTYAFELIAKPVKGDEGKKLRVVLETAQAAGWQGMVAGQSLDTLGSLDNTTLSDIEHVHNLKTGALLKASARLGAILGGGSEQEISVLSSYALELGLAFQIKDDILDVVGESADLGKSAGKDEKSGKPTYTTLLGLDGARVKLEESIAKAKDHLQYFGAKADFLRSLADYTAQRKN
ncbi:polyprenyl synthetase family protein [Dehalobacter sp. DCM]|uniref:polyprenyl synthetase family protein n=1 Tax=Dehalobacter sp. DCM TaxID=2907827 RepID=UPI003081C5F7|nr:polyprenyl synthetase family protein [Dehalobacter sp. DCM]